MPKRIRRRSAYRGILLPPIETVLDVAIEAGLLLRNGGLASVREIQPSSIGRCRGKTSRGTNTPSALSTFLPSSA